MKVNVKEAVRSVLRSVALLMRETGLTPPERIFRHLYRAGPFTIKLPSRRATLTLMSWGDRIENEFFWRGWRGHEPEEMEWWVRLSIRSNAVLDVGANTGVYAYMAKALNMSATVHAFEPLARVADRIRTNGTVSGLDVSVFEMAVAEAEGSVDIYDPGGENAYSASLDPDFLDREKTVYPVPITSIDAHCKKYDIDPDLIKIDVEGVEGRVILGARSTLLKGRAVILCEWRGSSSESAEAAHVLRESGYVALDLDRFEPVELSRGRSHEERNILLCPQAWVEDLIELRAARFENSE